MCKYIVFFVVSFLAFSCLPMQAQDLQNDSNYRAIVDSLNRKSLYEKMQAGNTSRYHHAYSSNSTIKPEIKNVIQVNNSRIVDYGPFMADLKRRIKRNWSPPKGEECKLVVLLFKVNRDGTLYSEIVIKKSSGSTEADAAALSAVELSAPFRPLPPEHRGSAQEIEFTFDFNAIGATRQHL